ncbi:hypothetical protein [Pseudomonas sp. EA_65y_Pfl1_P120]|uniref:hypothetical protein n=1 Tax=Pseudomonas sp. EA_65y_Pfl1_P120 TaxID=3088693 RepID=UPI0030D9F8C6
MAPTLWDLSQGFEHTKMKEKILSGFFSISGLSVAIGFIGFLSGIVTMFVNVSDLISVKWLLFALATSGIIILTLIKITYDLSNEKTPPPPYESPIKFIPEEKTFIIRRNENFINNIVLGCYAQIDEIDRLAYLAVVHLIQEKIIQVKIIADFDIFEKIPTTQEELKNLVIRPVVPFTAINQLNSLENGNV